MVEQARSRFRRFAAPTVECPLCGASDVQYEFVLQRVAFSHCEECGFLFGNRSITNPALNRSILDAPVGELARFIERYAGSTPEKTIVIGTAACAAIDGYEIQPASALAGSAKYDAIVLLGGIAGDDPLRVVESLSDRLQPGGTVLFAIPSTSSDVARRERNSWEPLTSAGRYFFNPDTLQLLATRAGLGDFLSFVDARDFASAPSKKLTAWFRSNFVFVARAVTRDDSHLLSVIFPVYNEANTVVESLTRVLEKQIDGVDIEIIVVESNSTDGSRALVERYREHPRVRLVLEDRPRGKGFAVRTGLTHAKGEVVLFQDADLEYDVDDYDALVAPLFGLRRNFVLGSRHNPRGASWKIRTFADQPLVANVANVAHVVLLKMFNTLYRQSLVDPFTMYKVFRRDCLKGLSFSCDRFDFDFEINIMLLRKGYQPLEIPINYLSRSFSEGKKVSFFGDPPTWIRAMLKLRRSVLYPS